MSSALQLGNCGRCRVILADNHAETPESLCKLLRDHFDVLATFASGKDVLEQAAELHPDVILLEITMPDMSGIAVARLLHRQLRSAPLLFVSQHTERYYIEEAFANDA